jgi:hypothetical protein
MSGVKYMSVVNLSSVVLSSNLLLSSGVLDTAQDISTNAVPQFAGVTLRGASGVLGATAGQVSAIELSDDFNYHDGRLSLKQHVLPGSSPTFSTITLKTVPHAVLSTDTAGIVGPVSLSGSLMLDNNTLTTAQDIQTSARPIFAGLTVGSLTLPNKGLLYSGDSVSAVAVGSGLVIADGSLSTAQDIRNTAIPKFAGLTIGATSALLCAVNGVVSPVALGDSLVFNAGALDTTQSIALNANVTFASVSVSALNLNTQDGLLFNVNHQVQTVQLGAGLVMQNNQLNTAQSLGASSTPTFTGLTIGTLSGVLCGVAGQVSTTRLSGNLKFTAGTLDTTQDIQATANVTFAGLTLGSLRLGNSTGLLYRSSGAVGNVNLGPNLVLSSGILDTAQSLLKTSSPTFATVTLTNSATGLCSIVDRQLTTVNLSPSLTLAANTLSTAQDLTATGSPKFAAITVGLLGGAGSALVSATNGNLSAVTLSTSLVFNAGTLDTVQPLSQTSVPKFAGLILNNVTGLLCGGLSGHIQPLATGPSLTISANTLDTAQPLSQTSAPTFAGLTTGTLKLQVPPGLIGCNNTNVLPVALGSGLVLNLQSLSSAGTLDTVQPLSQMSAPTFAGLTIKSLSGLLGAVGGLISQVVCGAGLTFNAGTLDTVQMIGPTASPTFKKCTVQELSVGSLSGLLAAAVGDVSCVTLGSNLTYIVNKLDTVQAIGFNATPVFAGVTLGALAAGGLVCSAAGTLSICQIGAGLSYSGGVLDVAQQMNATANVAFASVTTGALSLPGVSGLMASFGSVAPVTIGPSLTLTHNDINTLDTVQPLSQMSAPTFAGLTIGVTSALLCAVNGAVSPVYFNNNIIFNPLTKILNTCQDLTQHSSPAFASITLGSLKLAGLTGVMSAINGAVGLLNIAPNLSIINNVLDTVQPLSITSAPTFAGLTIGSLNGLLSAVSGVVSLVRVGRGLSYLNNILDTAQPLDISAAPRFSALTLSTLCISNLTGVMSAVSGVVATLNIGAGLKLSNNTLDTIQSLGNNAAPIFSGLTVGTDSGLLCKNNGLLSKVNIGPSLSYNALTVDTAQPLHAGSNPSFAGCTVAALTFGRNSGVLYGENGAVSNMVIGKNLNIVENTIAVADDPTFRSVKVGASQLGQAGYSTLPNGLIMQWANVAAGTWVFPMPFPVACVGVYNVDACNVSRVSADVLAGYVWALGY